MKNKLWILGVKDTRSRAPSENPWYRYYDMAYGFVVSAKTEKDARNLACKMQGDERTLDDKSPWLDPEYTTCEVLKAGTKTKVILRDYLAS